RIEPDTHRAFAGEAELALSPTEFRLLHYFLRNPDRVLSRSRLLDKVWGDGVYIEERTVDVHIRRLRLALRPTGHDRLIETVRGGGYRLAAACSASSASGSRCSRSSWAPPCSARAWRSPQRSGWAAGSPCWRSTTPGSSAG